MIEVISECMITHDGKDVVRQLVLDISNFYPCLSCMYRDWHPTSVDDPDCVTMHGCFRLSNSYFRIKY